VTPRDPAARNPDASAKSKLQQLLTKLANELAAAAAVP